MNEEEYRAMNASYLKDLAKAITTLRDAQTFYENEHHHTGARAVVEAIRILLAMLRIDYQPDVSRDTYKRTFDEIVCFANAAQSRATTMREALDYIKEATQKIMRRVEAQTPALNYTTAYIFFPDPNDPREIKLFSAEEAVKHRFARARFNNMDGTLVQYRDHLRRLAALSTGLTQLNVEHFILSNETMGEEVFLYDVDAFIDRPVS